jgi:hypothetical protein
MPIRKALLFAISSMMSFVSLRADTIISVTGPHGSTLALGATNQILVTSWSSTQTYSNVSIAFESIFGPFTGTAYLMTQIGPGTTTAQQVASGSYSVLSSSLSLTNLFTGLTLGPGTYFLVVTSETTGGWDTPYTAGPPVVTTGAGVTRGAQYIVNDGNGVPNLAYPPASTFSALNPVYDLKFLLEGVGLPTPTSTPTATLTGTPPTPTATPTSPALTATPTPTSPTTATPTRTSTSVPPTATQTLGPGGPPPTVPTLSFPMLALLALALAGTALFLIKRP